MSDDFDAYDLSEFTEEDFAAIDAELARARARPAIQIAIEKDSPFEKFLSWKKHLAVTDLVSPLWCEVQYEYSLYGKRYKPLHLRPSTFTSKSGKQIRVHQRVAHANDRRLKHGKTVHKALENELQPEKIIVRPVSEEERFGLRLLQLIDGFNQLISNGITRELPVFTITHSQVVLGVIDEVLRLPLAQSDHPSSTPSSSPPKKKQRLTPPPTPHLTPPALELPTTMNTVRGADSANTQDLYELRIVDYKTRRSSNIPLDEDSLSSRLQLMMYHRMLSSLLEPEAFDFDLLWNRLNLNPTKSFSAQFLKDTIWEQRQVDPADCNVHLNRLVSEWISTVQRKSVGLVGVSQQLQLVYRRSVNAGKQQSKGKHKAAEMADTDDLLEALALQEDLDLARAIEESLSEAGQVGQVTRHVAQNVEQVGPSFAVQNVNDPPVDTGRTDPTLAGAIQQSLTTCAHNAHAQVAVNGLPEVDATHDNPPTDETEPVTIASEGQGEEGTTLDMSPIIGTKEFRMNDEELDAHIVDVLRWWFGARRARGVDVNQTNRCFTCEYRESCEWREQKAREATRDGGSLNWEP